jgi:predicted SnoaL-like aldol condensation-catalyzing enzyme
MKMRTILVAAAAFAASAALHAQEPVVGVKDPEALFKGGSGKVAKNKEAALHIMRELLQCGQWDKAAEWLTPAYHQHNPNAASGRDGVVQFFTQVMKVKRTDSCATLTSPVVAVQADGDYVTVVTPREYKNPNAEGKCYFTTWFDTWRFVDGKADEHWDSAILTGPGVTGPANCPKQ